MGGTAGRLDRQSTTAQRAIDRPPAVSSPCRPAPGAVATVPTRTKPSGSPRAGLVEPFIGLGKANNALSQADDRADGILQFEREDGSSR